MALMTPPRVEKVAASPHHAAPCLLTQPELLTAQQYIADATRLICAARHRVYLTALTMADERETDALIAALVAAARRGVEVQVAADVFTYADAAGTFLPKRYQSRRQRASSQLATKIADAGGTFTWLGRERGLIFRGRTHTKFCVVDDARLADDLVGVYRRVQQMTLAERGHRSREYRYGKDRVLVDGGLVGDSIIYRRALKYARKAQRVLLISQYCPTGELGDVIKSKPHALCFNPPSNASFANHVLIRTSMIMNHTATKYRRKEYLHAKCIIFYLKNGKRVAITGSHNFVWGGVMLGTREIALQTKSPHVIDQIEHFFDTHVRIGGTRTQAG